MNCSPRKCHRLLKEVTRRGGISHVASVIKDGKGRLLFESKDKRLHWRRYVTSLYNDSSRNTETTALKGQPSGEPILREEVESALKSIRLEKTNGEEGMTADFMVEVWDPLTGSFFVLFSESNEVEHSNSKDF